MDARLDAATRQKVDDLAKYFHEPRATVLCQIMEWSLSRAKPGSLDQGASQGPVRHLSLYVASELHEQMQKAATAAGVKGAQWLRHMVRQITIQDFPAIWQAATPRERSHDSRIYTERFMLRFDHLTREKLDALATHFNKPASEVIRDLITQAKPGGFSQELADEGNRTPRAPGPAITTSNAHKKTLLSPRRALWYWYRNTGVMSREAAWQVSLTLLQPAAPRLDTPVRGDRDGIRWQLTDPAAVSRLE
jgi:predicted transcriptional regulator